jgi:hypothetical protein
MISASDSSNPEYRPPLTLSPLAIEDFTGEPVFHMTADGLAEIQGDQTITLTPHLLDRLAKFTAARIARENARGKELLPALTGEELAAVELAWALECTVNKGR